MLSILSFLCDMTIGCPFQHQLLFLLSFTTNYQRFTRPKNIHICQREAFWIKRHLHFQGQSSDQSIQHFTTDLEFLSLSTPYRSVYNPGGLLLLLRLKKIYHTNERDKFSVFSNFQAHMLELELGRKLGPRG